MTTPSTPTTTVGASSTASTPGSPARRPASIQWDRVAIGVLLAVAGVGWLLDTMTVSVPWHLAPAIGVITVGAILLLTLTGGTGRASLVVLGVVLSVVAVAVGVGAGRFAGPVGERVIVAGHQDWPDRTQMAAGTVTVDLTRAPLPAGGSMTVEVGAGRVELRLPADHPVRVDADVVMGKIVIDGVAVEQGFDLSWTDPSTAAAPLAVTVELGMGDVEVFHENP
jgi:hypothetical protein